MSSYRAQPLYRLTYSLVGGSSQPIPALTPRLLRRTSRPATGSAASIS